MNQLKGNMAAKIIAVILLAASCLVLCGAVAGISWLDGEGAYNNRSVDSVRQTMIDNALECRAYPLLYRLVNSMTVREAGYDQTELRFELLDEQQQPIAGTLGADETVLRSRTVNVSRYEGGVYFIGENELLYTRDELRNWDYTPETDLSFGEEPSPLPTPTPAPQPTDEPAFAGEPEGTRVWYIRMSWTDASESGSLNTELRACELLFPWRYELIGVAVGAFVLAVLLFVFLMAAAGHRDATGAVTPCFVERIPIDLLWLGSAALACLPMQVLANFVNRRNLVGSLLIAALCLVCIGLLLLLCLMSTAVRLKLKSFLSSCLIWRLLRWCWKWLKTGFGLLRGLPLVWKWIPVFLILFFLDFVYTMYWRSSNGGMLALGLLFKALLLGVAILYLALAFDRLRRGAKAIAQGAENVVVDEKYLVGALEDHAKDLNHIRDGLSRAVDERMKSERLRTELITNVSHDIKTPLTSIINYVDLLAREEPENEKTREYIGVLQRQSARLKKLTDDLVEASKAATGNLPASPEKLELGVLLDQTAGEYGERLAEKQLELRVTKPDEPITVWADPRHLWRILDNLMSNILKYAQPGTRVYLDLKREGGKAELSFRNISAQPLNIRPEELTERFVRGDSSRSTEGSGLGLAIAASLAKLQGIDMALTVDGDLFKVVLRFSTVA